MKKYLIICLLPLLKFSYAKGDFLISDNFIFWLFAIPIGFIIFMIAMFSSISSVEDKELKEKVQKDQNNKNTQ